MRSGEFCERPPLALHIVAIDGSCSDGRLWPTPTASDWKGQSQPGQRRGTLSEAVEEHPCWTLHFSRPAGDPHYGQKLSKEDSRRRLNPDFVDWLMGLPPAWTCLEPIASGPAGMESFLFRLRRRLQYLLKGAPDDQVCVDGDD